MKKWEKILPSVVVISLLLLLGCVSVDAQGNNDYDEGVWTDQCKLNIHEHQSNKTVRADGVDKAKMNIVIRDKKTNQLTKAQSDVKILLNSEKGIIEPQTVTVTISKGEIMSEAISLTSKKPGIARVKAEAAGFEAVSASVEFVPPPKPCKLSFDARPTENITADGKHPTNLSVKLLLINNEPHIPQVDDIYVDIVTNRGENFPKKIKIPKDIGYGEGQYKTYRWGTVKITAVAKSVDFDLEGSTDVTFVRPFTSLTLLLALLGGFLGGSVKYYQEHKQGIVFWPKRQRTGTWRLGMIGHSIFHALFGVIIYIGACLNIPPTNLFKVDIECLHGAFMIGFIGGVFFFLIISLWGLYIKRTS